LGGFASSAEYEVSCSDLIKFYENVYVPKIVPKIFIIKHGHYKAVIMEKAGIDLKTFWTQQIQMGKPANFDFTPNHMKELMETTVAFRRGKFNHFDLKPKNIMVKINTEGKVHIYIVDFGGSRHISVDMETFVGWTRLYLNPKCFQFIRENQAKNEQKTKEEIDECFEMADWYAMKQTCCYLYAEMKRPEEFAGDHNSYIEEPWITFGEDQCRLCDEFSKPEICNICKGEKQKTELEMMPYLRTEVKKRKLSEMKPYQQFKTEDSYFTNIPTLQYANYVPVLIPLVLFMIYLISKIVKYQNQQSV